MYIRAFLRMQTVGAAMQAGGILGTIQECCGHKRECRADMYSKSDQIYSERTLTQTL